MIALDAGVLETRYALAPQPHLGVGLSARLNVELHRSVHGLNDGGAAQCRPSEADGLGGIDIGALALKEGMLRHSDIHQKIASRTAVGAGVAAICPTERLTVIDTGRNGDLHGLHGGNVALAAAVRTLLLDDLAAAVAVRTGNHLLNGAEHALLGHDHLAAAAALRTGLR